MLFQCFNRKPWNTIPWYLMLFTHQNWQGSFKKHEKLVLPSSMVQKCSSIKHSCSLKGSQSCQVRQERKNSTAITNDPFLYSFLSHTSTFYMNPLFLLQHQSNSWGMCWQEIPNKIHQHKVYERTIINIRYILLV